MEQEPSRTIYVCSFFVGLSMGLLASYLIFIGINAAFSPC